jgi:KDO2-lipid IV(A) lauroyltransferase
MLTYLALRLLSIIVPMLPFWFGYRLFHFLGDASFLLHSRARRNVAANLRRVLGDEVDDVERQVVARSIFRTAALNYYDLFRVPRLDLDRLATLISVRGWEYVEQARSGGKGAIIVAPHLGNLDVVGQLTVIKGVPCTIPTEHVQPERLLKLVTAMRSSRGLTIVPIDGSAGPARTLYQALRRNEVVGIVADRDVQANGLRVPFFGAITQFPSGPVALALRTGAPVLPARALRRDKGRYDLKVAPPLALPRTGDAKRDVQSGTELLALALEGFIRETPGQWVVFEPVWPQSGEKQESGEPVHLGGDVLKEAPR